MRAYSEDLRERAVQCAAVGGTIGSMAAALQIGPCCVSKWRKRQRETGALTAGLVGCHKRRMLPTKGSTLYPSRKLSVK